jgi:cytochrome P450
MKYLRWVQNEFLRLIPVIPANGRIAVRDITLPLGGGPNGKAPVFLPKARSSPTFHSSSIGERTSTVRIPMNSDQRGGRSSDPGWEYLPLNGGPRVCVGQQFALLEASYATIRLMQAFSRIEARDEREWCEYVSLILASRIGRKVALFES